MDTEATWRRVTQSEDELCVMLDLPDHARKQIHGWVLEQDWPEGTDLHDPEDYHITLMYTPGGNAEHKDADWIDHLESAPARITGVDVFTEDPEKGYPYVLRLDAPEIKRHAEKMQSRAEDHGLEITHFPGGYKPHITVGYGPDPEGIEPNEMTLEFHAGPSFVAEPREDDDPTSSVKKAGSTPERGEGAESWDLDGLTTTVVPNPRLAVKSKMPPNLRPASGKDRCGTCAMFSDGVCTSFDNYPVDEYETCDVYEPAPGYHESAAPEPETYGEAQLLDQLSLRSVAHNLHYKFEEGGLDAAGAKDYAERLLKMIGYPPDDMTTLAALQAWQTAYPQDRVLAAPQEPAQLDQAPPTTPTESWGYSTSGAATTHTSIGASTPIDHQGSADRMLGLAAFQGQGWLRPDHPSGRRSSDDDSPGGVSGVGGADPRRIDSRSSLSEPWMLQSGASRASDDEGQSTPRHISTSSERSEDALHQRPSAGGGQCAHPAEALQETVSDVRSREGSRTSGAAVGGTTARQRPANLVQLLHADHTRIHDRAPDAGQGEHGGRRGLHHGVAAEQQPVPGFSDGGWGGEAGQPQPGDPDPHGGPADDVGLLAGSWGGRQSALGRTSPELGNILNAFGDRYGVTLLANEEPDSVSFNHIEIPPRNRGAGVGSRLMAQLKSYCDRSGKQLAVQQVVNAPFFSQFPWLHLVPPDTFVYQPQQEPAAEVLPSPTEPTPEDHWPEWGARSEDEKHHYDVPISNDVAV